ncbi:MAG: TspO/MBR family protein [Sarcina sp.]
MFNIFKVEGEFNLGDLIISLIIHLGGCFLIGMFMGNAKGVYDSLKQPFFSPPAYVFGIVWPILYILMAIAAYRIYEVKKKKNTKGALGIYIIQLIFNFAWSIIFFNFKLYGLATIELFILLILIIVTIWKFFNVDKISAYLLIPYGLWSSFALVLSYFIWMLNEM